MAKEKRLLLGGMDKDSDLRLIKNGDYKSAVNARVATSESEGDFGALSNMKGAEKITQLITSSYPGKDHICIGSVEDPSFDRVFYFVAYVGLGEPTADEVDSVWEYHLGTNTAFPILSSDELNFSANHRINDADVVAHRESYAPEGLLLFTDGNNPPRKINIAEEKLISGLSEVINSSGRKKKYKCNFTGFEFNGADPIMEFYQPTPNTVSDRINAAVCAPLHKPTVELDTDENVNYNNYIKSKSFKFKYRYVYRDRQKSAWSPISELAASEVYIPADLSSSVIEDNVVKVGVRIDNRYIAGVELAVRDVASSDQYMHVDTLSYDYQRGWYSNDDINNSVAITSFPTTTSYDAVNNPSPLYYDNTTIWYYFYNEETYSTINEKESNNLFNNIPIKAKTQAVIDGNRLAYGNVTTGRDPYLPGLQLQTYIADKLSATASTVFGSITASSSSGAVRRKRGGFCSCYRGIAFTNYTVKLNFPTTLPSAASSIDLSSFEIKDLPFSHFDAQFGVNSIQCPCNDIKNFAIGTITLSPDTGGNAPTTPASNSGSDLRASWYTSFLNRISTNFTPGTTLSSGNMDNGVDGDPVINVINKNGVTIKAGHLSDTTVSYSGTSCDPNWDVNDTSRYSNNFVGISGNSLIFRFSVVSNSMIKLRTSFFACGRSVKSLIGEINKVTVSTSLLGNVQLPHADYPITTFPVTCRDSSIDYLTSNILGISSVNGPYSLASNSTWEQYIISQGGNFNNPESAYSALSNISPVYSPLVSYALAQDEQAPVKNIFKTGAYHTFGVVYYDKQGRSSSVQDRQRVYVPTHMEVIDDIDNQNGLFDTSPDWTGSSDNDDQALFGIEWKISKTKAPNWADYYQIVYTGNQNIEKFEQVTSDGFHFPEDSRLADYVFIDITPLKRQVEGTGGNSIDYEYGPGDRIRIINTYNNSNNSRISGVTSAASIQPKFDFNIVDLVEVTRYSNPSGLQDEVVSGTLTNNAAYTHVKAKGKILDIVFEADPTGGNATGINVPSRGDTEIYVVIDKRDLATTDQTSSDDDIWNADGLGATTAGAAPILTNALVELYRPKTNVDDQQLLFYEFDDLYSIDETSFTHACEFTLGSSTVTFFNGVSGGFDYSDGAGNYQGLPVSLPGTPNIGDELINPNAFSEAATIIDVTLDANGTHITEFTLNIEAQATYSDQNDSGFPQTNIATYSHSQGVNSFIKLLTENNNVNGDAYVRKKKFDMNGANQVKWSESYHFNDFLKSNEWSKGRPNKEITYYSETTKESTIIYTDPVVANTYINGLNISYEDSYFEEYDKANGSIQKLHSKDNYIVIMQEDKISKALVNRNMTFNADGSNQVGLSSQVLSKAVPYPWQGGIGFHPESFAFYGDDMYFYDSQRGEVIKISDRGVEVISNNGMSSFFRQKSKELVLQDKEIKVRGAYDVSTSEYVLSFDGIYQKEEVNLCELFSNGTGGVWDAAVIYNASDVVAYEDPTTLEVGYWVSQIDNNIGVTPEQGTSWHACNAQSLDILGCTDPLATNYNPTALIDDGSCIYECFSDVVGDITITSNLVDFSFDTEPSTVSDLLIPDPDDMATGTLSITPTISPTANYQDGFAIYLIYGGEIVAGEFGATGTSLYEGLEAGFYQVLIIDMASLFESSNFSDSWDGTFEDAGNGLSGQEYEDFLTDVQNAFELIQDCGVIVDVQVNLLACDNPNALNYVGVNIDPTLIDNPTTIGDQDPCFFDIEGCTDVNADNYNAVATLDDGSCVDCVTPAPLNQLFTASITDVNVIDAASTVDITVTVTGEAENDPSWTPFYEINIYSFDLITNLETIYQTNNYAGSYTNIGNLGQITFSGLPGLNSSATSVQSYRVEVIAVGMCSDASETLTPVGLGCTNSSSINYSPLAVSDNGSCIDCNTISTPPTPGIPATTTTSFGSSPGFNNFTVVIDENGIESLVAPVEVSYTVSLRSDGIIIPSSGSFVNPLVITATGSSSYTANFIDVPYNGTQTGYSALLETTYTLGDTDTTPVTCTAASADFITPIEGCVVEGAPNYNSNAAFDCSGVLQSQSFTVLNPAGISAVGTAIGDGTLDASCCGLCNDFTVVPLNQPLPTPLITVTDSTSSGSIDLNTGSIDIDSSVNLGGSGQYSFTIIDASTGVSHTNGSLPAGDYLIVATDVNYLCEETTSVIITVGVEIVGCTDDNAQNFEPSATISATETQLPIACQTCFPDCYLQTLAFFPSDVMKIHAGIFGTTITGETFPGADDGSIRFSIEDTIGTGTVWHDHVSQISDFLTFITNQSNPSYITISLYTDSNLTNLISRGYVGSLTPASLGNTTNPSSGTVLFSELSDITHYWKIEYNNIPSTDVNNLSAVSMNEFFYSSDNTSLDVITGVTLFNGAYDVDNCLPQNDFNGPTPIQYKNLQGCEYSGEFLINTASCLSNIEWATGGSFDYNVFFNYAHGNGNTGITVTPDCGSNGEIAWTYNIPTNMGISSVSYTLINATTNSAIQNANFVHFPGESGNILQTGAISAGSTYQLDIAVEYTSGIVCNYSVQGIDAQCEGCMDSTATNYNPNATIPGSCNFIVSACFDSGFDNSVSLPSQTDNGVPFNALNFNAAFPQTVTSTQSPNNTYEVTSTGCTLAGCSDEFADNYNPNATVDDGSCLACLEPTAQNYASQAASTTQGDSSLCVYCDGFVNILSATQERCITSEHIPDDNQESAYNGLPSISGPAIRFEYNTGHSSSTIPFNSAQIPGNIYSVPNVQVTVFYTPDDSSSSTIFTQYIDICDGGVTPPIFSYNGFTPADGINVSSSAPDANGKITAEIFADDVEGISRFEAGTYIVEVKHQQMFQTPGALQESGISCIFPSAQFRFEEQCPVSMPLIALTGPNNIPSFDDNDVGIALDKVVVTTGQVITHGTMHNSGGYIRLRLDINDLPCWLDWDSSHFEVFDLNRFKTDSTIHYDSSSQNLLVDINMGGRVGFTNIVIQLANNPYISGDDEAWTSNPNNSYCRYRIRLRLDNNNQCLANSSEDVITPSDYRFAIRIVNDDPSISTEGIGGANTIPFAGNVFLDLSPFDSDTGTHFNYRFAYRVCGNTVTVETGSQPSGIGTSADFITNWKGTFTSVSGTGLDTTNPNLGAGILEILSTP